MRKSITTTLCAVALLAMAVSANADVTLKGTGKGDFNYSGWTGIFDLTDDEYTGDVIYWHLVDSGANANTTPGACYMHLDFNDDNGDLQGEFNWYCCDGFSRNAGGKNPGWVIVAPASWGVPSGFVDQTAGKNGQFNISDWALVAGEGEEDDPGVTLDLLNMYIHLTGNWSGGNSATATALGAEVLPGGKWQTYIPVSGWVSFKEGVTFDIKNGNGGNIIGTVTIYLVEGGFDFFFADNDGNDLTFDEVGISIWDAEGTPPKNTGNGQQMFKSKGYENPFFVEFNWNEYVLAE